MPSASKPAPRASEGAPAKDPQAKSPRDGAQPYASETEDYEGDVVEKPNKREVDDYVEDKKARNN